MTSEQQLRLKAMKLAVEMYTAAPFHPEYMCQRVMAAAKTIYEWLKSGGDEPV